MLTLLLLLVVSTTASVPPLQPLMFAKIYSDYMVLQRDRPASIWGWSDPNTTIYITLKDMNNNTVTTSADVNSDTNGRWKILLPAQAASTPPVSVIATSSKEGVDSGTATITNVLFGDVYLCSGQSNMAFSVATPTNDEKAEAEIVQMYRNDPGASRNGYVSTDAAIKDSSNYPSLRFLVIGNKQIVPNPIQDYYPSPGNNNSDLTLTHPWQQPSPSTIGVGKDVMGGLEPGTMSATCYYFGLELHQTQNIPIGLIHSSYGGSAVEDWISQETLGDGTTGPCIGNITHSMGIPSNQYNGQIRPLMNMTITGAIWYQGESNHGQNALYTCRYELMMKEWRKQWNVGTDGATDLHFPIGFVQVGPLSGVDVPMMTNNSDSFLIRMGQTAGYGYAPNQRWPNSFMATAFDLSNPMGTHAFWGNIHIFNKQAVAHRLALSARNMIYNESLVYSGPRVIQAVVNDATNQLIVSFDVIGTEGKGILLRGRFGFEISSNGKVWERLNVTSNTKTTVVLNKTGTTTDVQFVRYAWEDGLSVFNHTGPAVFNGEGLPATPFLINVTKLKI